MNQCRKKDVTRCWINRLKICFLRTCSLSFPSFLVRRLLLKFVRQKFTRNFVRFASSRNDRIFSDSRIASWFRAGKHSRMLENEIARCSVAYSTPTLVFFLFSLCTRCVFFQRNERQVWPALPFIVIRVKRRAKCAFSFRILRLLLSYC